MIIYEVKLELIDKTIYSSFILWLTSHIKEMLRHKGFLKSEIDNSDLIIGCRAFDSKTPLRSRIGNYITSVLIKLDKGRITQVRSSGYNPKSKTNNK